MPTIEIKALDTLFFRDGKPFEMGDDNWAEGIFPPPPSVIYGALRSAWFAEHPEEMDKMGQENDPTKELRITRIYIGVKGIPYLPLPLDFVENKGDNESELNLEASNRKYKVHIQTEKVNVISSNPFDSVLFSSTHVEGISKGVLSIQQYNWYLQNLVSRNYTALKLSDYMLNEAKVGNARENTTHSVLEGKLYRVGMQRLNQISLYIKFTGIVFNSSLVKLGAENKVGHINNEVNQSNFKLFTDKIYKNFKIIFTTPTIFKNGWLPEWINKNTLKGSYNGVEFTLTNAILGKAEPIGGYDMKKNRPKPMLKAIPAGSVFYFETNSDKSINEIFLQKGLCDDFSSQPEFENIDFNKQGYGQFLIAKQ